MTAKELAEKLSAIQTILPDGERVVTDGFCGDPLSYCMSKAKPNGAWLTIMNNSNVAAVASLCDVSLVVLCDGVVPDEVLKARCETNGVNLAVTALPIFEAAGLLYKAL